MNATDNQSEVASSSGAIRVAVTTDIQHLGLSKLAPQLTCPIHNCEILLNPEPETECDYWIVFAAGRPGDRMIVSPDNTLFIAGEPPTKKIYPRAYYAQFERVVSCHAEDPHPRVEVSAPGLPWHVGLDRSTNSYRYGYKELSELQVPANKLNRLSVVCSDLRTTQGQRDRLAFLDYLKRALPDSVDHFGRGYNPIDDKMDAILPYRFHLVLENSRVAHYWTEKLADAFLGWSHPIYSGCPNPDAYFPKGSYTAIDIDKPQEALDLIRNLLNSDPNPIPLSESRELVLNRYNPFVRFAYWARRYYQPTTKSKTVYIRNHRAFRPFPRGLIYRLKSSLRTSQ